MRISGIARRMNGGTVLERAAVFVGQQEIASLEQLDPFELETEDGHRVRVEIARSLADEAARTGHRDQAARFYLRILERDPYDEPAHLGLVTTLSESGRHGEARRRYGLYAARMDELEIEAAAFPAVVRAG